MKNDHGSLCLDNQLCFRLYSASKEVTRRYRPFLDPLGLTYTQYIAMMVLWEQERMSVKDLGARLRLESSTLTPMLKKLESSGYITRTRSTTDERVVVVELTDAGRELHDRAMSVPPCIFADLGITPELGIELANLLDEFMRQIEEK